MKIGILTLPLHTNYGGILQAYALQTVLERMGHEVEFIDGRKYKRAGLKTKIKECAAHILYSIGMCNLLKYVHAEYYAVNLYTNAFIEQHIHVHRYPTICSVKESSFDAIIVGSDQVWRPIYFGNSRIENAYLYFTKGWQIKRIAYAVSFGVDQWEMDVEKIKQCKEAISWFDAVSVREESGVALCKHYLQKDAQWVLDPTMLLTATDYNKILFHSVSLSSSYLFTYIIDSDKRKEDIVSALSTNLCLSILVSNSHAEDTTGGSCSIRERIQPPLESWLNGIMNASFVVTDSFHACVFSIIFNKPFYVIGNPNRGMARFESLLSMFGLRDRLISCRQDIDFQSSIDYEKVNHLLSELKQKSLNFLYANL